MQLSEFFKRVAASGCEVTIFPHGSVMATKRHINGSRLTKSTGIPSTVMHMKPGAEEAFVDEMLRVLDPITEGEAG